MCQVNGKAKNSTAQQLPHSSTDLSETQNQERYPGYDPACKIWLTTDDGKEVYEDSEFWITGECFLFHNLVVIRRISMQ